jgi:hypothetical protein
VEGVAFVEILVLLGIAVALVLTLGLVVLKLIATVVTFLLGAL